MKTKTTLDSILTKHPSVVSRVFNGEVILFSPEETELHALNRSATRIWELLDGKRSLKEIAGLLEREGLDNAMLEEDFLDFVEELLANILIEKT